jgi:hypothetical protein
MIVIEQVVYHVVFSDGWDDVLDMPGGAARCIGSAATLGAAMALAADAGIEGRLSGWDGQPYITDAQGCRVRLCERN